MGKSLLIAAIVFAFLGCTGCDRAKKNKVSSSSETVQPTERQASGAVPQEPEKRPLDFLPQGYKVFEQVHGDLNKDGQEDCVLLIKGTDTGKIVRDENRGALDRNRRGIIILFKKSRGYELAVKNDDCFSSENEDGGVYFAPELTLDVAKGNLLVNYAHGRYGYWSYTFRYQHGDFELIGYDASSNSGPVVNTETSINYLTGKKIVKQNTNEAAEGGDEVFKETVSRMKPGKLIRLSEIRDFDELEVPGGS